MGRSYAVALSFANLVYLCAWDNLAIANPRSIWFRKSLPTVQQYAAVAAAVLAFSLLAYAVLRAATKGPDWSRRALLVTALLLVAVPVSAVVARHMPEGIVPALTLREVFAVAGLEALVALGLLFRYLDWAVRVARVAALAALPSVAVTFGGVGIITFTRPPLAPDPPLATRLPGGPPVRVLWLIFDEWDQRLTFTNRLPGIALPAIDRLAAVSFMATRALAPEAGARPVRSMYTSVSMPSLLYAKRVVTEHVEDAERLDLEFADGSRARFGEGDNFFSLAHSRGWNLAVGGWYLPYCRVFGSEVASCYWDQLYEGSNAIGPGFGEALWQNARLLGENPLLTLFTQKLTATRHADEYRALADFARRTAADPAIGLALVHFNIPHVPYYYRGANGVTGYDATLELVDRTVAEVLAALSRSGLDKRTALILSADHPARFPTRIDRGQDPHVPFIVHLPGDRTGMVFDGEFSALATVPLALAVASGEVDRPEAIAAFVTMQSVGWPISLAAGHEDGRTR